MMCSRRRLYENGAQSNGIHHLDPPADAFERLKLQAEFYSAVLAREIKDFRAYKDACVEAAATHRRYQNLPGVPADAPVKLKLGAERIENLREKLRDIANQLKTPAELQREQALAAAAQQREEREEQLLNEINGIEV